MANRPSLGYAFSKSSRLLDSKAFKAVFDDAQLKASRPQILLLSRFNLNGKPRLGLVIAKKNIRQANQRNRVKRVVRESFRLNQHQLPTVDIVVLARRGLDEFDNTQLHRMLEQLWQQLAKKANKQQQTG